MLAVVGLRPELRLPDRHAPTLAIDRRTGSGRCRSTSPSRRDGRYVLVSNWCSYDLSVVSTASGRRGAAGSRSGRTRGASRVDPKPRRVRRRDGLDERRAGRPARPGRAGSRGSASGPRHVVIGPGRPLPLRHAERGGARSRRSTCAPARSSRRSRTGKRAAQHDDRARRAVALRRQLRVAARSARCGRATCASCRPSPPAPTRSGSPTTASRGRVWVACYGGSILVMDDR